MKLPKLRTVFSTSLLVISTIGIVSLGIALLLFNQLETLVPAYSSTEVLTAESVSSIETIISNPINAPYKLVLFAISSAVGDPLLSTRITSAVFGTLTILMFYYIVRKFHSKRIAFLATISFACSAWFLHVARFGAPDIMLPFTLLLFIVCGYLLMKDNTRSLVSIAAVLALGSSIYVPGMLWFVVFAILIRRTKDMSAIIHDVPKFQIGVLVTLLISLVFAPLTWAVISRPSIGLEILGLPSSLPNVATFFHDFIAVPISLVAFTHENPELWLGRLPLLDIATSALFIAGMYYYFKSRSLDRSKLMVLCMLIATLLIAIGGGITNAILLPLVYVAVAGGIALMIVQWFTVFPKNPLAQSTGIILISIIIGISMVYNLRSYFIAWPNWPPVNSVYTQTDANLIQ